MLQITAGLMRQWLRIVTAALALGTLASASARAESPVVVAVPGAPTLLLSAFDLTAHGYTTSEFFVSGTASSYRLTHAPDGDGRWDATAAATAPYATRMVVARPTDPTRFNGTVVVEWLNVSAGGDSAPDWNAVHRELMRGGYVWVGVSAQKVGVEGGPSLGAMGTPLKKANPVRYGALSHPGDAFAFDIYSQAGALLRSASASQILGSLVPKRVIAAGESQSAVYLTSYVNAVDPLAKVYDGFLIHSRFGSSPSVENPSMDAPSNQPKFVRLRTDLRVPALTVLTETDLMDSRIAGYHGARQPDNSRLRVWEMAGTAHADNYTFGLGFQDSGSLPLDKLAAGYVPMSKILGTELVKPINNAPQHHYIVEAALWQLDRWIRTGRAPPSAKPMTLNQGAPPDAPVTFAVDANGLVQGGIRTPWVDVPTARLSGVGNSGGALAFLAGVCEPFDAATLSRLYPGGKPDYLKRFEKSLAAVIRTGFILPADRQEILGLAAIAYQGP